MLTSDFDYPLPAELIAQRPLGTRHASRLLVLGRGGVEHTLFGRFPERLQYGDALIVNDTRVIPARLRGRKATGGAVELLLVEGVGRRWRCMARGAGLRSGASVALGEGVAATLLARRDGFWEVEFDSDLCAGGLLSRIGEVPTPPYIREPLREGERYQTVYAREPGSIAAPTAGLHFTPQLLSSLERRGVAVERLTLHIGPGTFLPLRAERVDGHQMHPERVLLTSETADSLNSTREGGGRWCAVGTSTVRALESACTRDGKVRAMDGPTDLFIYPGHDFCSGMELLLTNFHLPRSTNLLLVCAYGGTRRVLDAYRQAAGLGYRFYTFGDAMLLEGGAN